MRLTIANVAHFCKKKSMATGYRCSHREFFHINIDKYSALYLASKASALLLDLFIYLLYNNRAINSNLTKAVSNFQEVLLMKAEESIVTHDLLRIVSV